MENLIMPIVFAVLFFATFALHGNAVMRYWSYIKLGQKEEVNTPISSRIKSVLVNVILQKKLFKEPIRGIFHVFVFYGFLVYSLHTASQFIGGFLGDYEFYIPALFGTTFLHSYDYTVDIFSILVLVGLGFFAARRWGI